jgi:hypothetical protein
MKQTSKILLPFVALVFVACGGNLKYVPKPVAIEPYKIPDMIALQPIRLMNVQPVGPEIDVTVQPYTVKVDLHSYTQTVIEVMKKQLREKGVPVSDTAEKIVKVAVIDVGIIPRAAIFKCDISYTVEAENIARFGAEASAENWNFQKAIDLAVTEAAVRIMNDQRFIGFVEQ